MRVIGEGIRPLRLCGCEAPGRDWTNSWPARASCYCFASRFEECSQNYKALFELSFDSLHCHRPPELLISIAMGRYDLVFGGPLCCVAIAAR